MFRANDFSIGKLCIWFYYKHIFLKNVIVINQELMKTLLI